MKYSVWDPQRNSYAYLKSRFVQYASVKYSHYSPRYSNTNNPWGCPFNKTRLKNKKKPTKMVPTPLQLQPELTLPSTLLGEGQKAWLWHHCKWNFMACADNSEWDNVKVSKRGQSCFCTMINTAAFPQINLEDKCSQMLYSKVWFKTLQYFKTDWYNYMFQNFGNQLHGLKCPCQIIHIHWKYANGYSFVYTIAMNLGCPFGIFYGSEFFGMDITMDLVWILQPG